MKKKVCVLLIFGLAALCLCDSVLAQSSKPKPTQQKKQIQKTGIKVAAKDEEDVLTTPEKPAQPQPQAKVDEKFNLIKQISKFGRISFSEKNITLTVITPSRREQYVKDTNLKYSLTISVDYKDFLFYDSPQITFTLDSLNSVTERDKFQLTNEINIFADSEKLTFVRMPGESYGRLYLPKGFEINLRHLETFAASNSLNLDIAGNKVQLDEYTVKTIKQFNQLIK